MFGRIGKRKDHRPLIDPRHRLDNLLREGAPDGADTNEGARFDALDRSNKIVSRRMPVRIRLLEINKIRAVRLKEAVDIEHIDSGLSVLERHPLLDHCRRQQIGETDAGGSRTEEKELFVSQHSPLHLRRIDHSGEYDSCCALDVIVVDAVFVAIALKQVNGVHTGPVLEMNAALREDLLNSFNELVDERI